MQLQQSTQDDTTANGDIKSKHRYSENNNKINDSDKNIKYIKSDRKHRRRYHTKKHEASNYGTKEPKGPTEAHIEWQPEGKV